MPGTSLVRHIQLLIARRQPSAQWLAVGDDEGRITLLNTLPSQDMSAERPTSNPQWQASQNSILFELAWRFDDRSISSPPATFRFAAGHRIPEMYGHVSRAQG